MFCYNDSFETLYETTFSQDIRIENELQRNKQDEIARKELLDNEREAIFNEISKEKEDMIFHLKGLKILKFTHKKVKFMFEPSKVVEIVSKRVRFICSLKYLGDYEYWIVKRDSFPSDMKKKIYTLFYTGDFFAVDDYSLPNVITKIYKRLEAWSSKEEIYRLEKIWRFHNNEDVYLDTDDEEIFLNEQEKKELHSKRNAILKRMLPPEKAKRSTRRRKLS